MVTADIATPILHFTKNRTGVSALEREEMINMSDTNFCLQCGKPIGLFAKTCKYCGTNQFGENNEFYPDKKTAKQTKQLLKSNANRKKQKWQGYTDEEILALGLYPQNKNYKMNIISQILGRK